MSAVLLFGLLLVPLASFSQKTITFPYKESGKQTEFTGSVKVHFEQIHDDGQIFVFSNVPNVVLNASGDKNGKIRIKFQELTWAKKKHKNNKIQVKGATLLTPNGMLAPSRGFMLGRDETKELMYPIVSNATGSLTIFFDVISASGETTSRAGKVSFRYLMKREESAWEAASRANDCESYSGFLRDYPDSRRKGEVRALVDQLCNRKPTVRNTPKPQPKNQWQICSQNPTKNCLERFIGSQYDHLAAEALDAMDQREWNAARNSNLCEDYQRYMTKWSKGKFTGIYTYEAAIALKNCEQKIPEVVVPAEPDPEYLAYQACIQANEDSLVPLCKSYLNVYPKGRYVRQVTAKLPLEADPFTRDLTNDQIFQGKLRFAIAPLSVEKVLMKSVDNADLMLIQPTEDRFVYGDSILEIQTFPDGGIQATAMIQEVFEVTMGDATGRTHVFTIDASQPRIEVTFFSDGQDSIVYRIKGGKPPYIMQFLPVGSEGVVRELSGLLTNGSIKKADIISMDPDQLNGTFSVRFTDERRTESVMADQTVDFDGDTNYLLYFLLLLLILVLAWLGYNFFRKRKFS
ncbi:MAG: hypothetical protein AAF399_11745 [Bacteroidota bacterium]